MKKVIVLMSLIFILIKNTSAQNEANAIGLRFGGGDGVGTELSYQRFLGNMNRVELDLGYRFSGTANYLTIAGIYQWVFDINGSFYWFVGSGAGVGFLSESYIGNDNFIFSAAGQLGLEYNFDFPLQLAIDIRPLIEVLPDFGDFHGDAAFSARFRF